MGVESVLGAVAGPVVGGLLGGSDGGGGSTTTTATNAPWSPIQGFLVGGNQQRRLKPGVQPIYDSNGGNALSFADWSAQQQNNLFGDAAAPSAEDYLRYAATANQSQKLLNPESDYETVGQQGLADIAAGLYGTTGMSQQQKDWLGAQIGMNAGFQQDAGLLQSIWENGRQANAGTFDTAIKPAEMVNLQKARAEQGVLDPTASMQRMLSGRVDTQTLDPVINNATQRLTQNFNEQVMPGINQGAIMAGQYGGSRQGVAQGIASRGLAQSIGDMQSNMYNNAFNTAQGQMYGTANALNNQASQNAQFNSNLQLQNNAQQMQQAQNNLNNRVVGSNLITGGQNAMNTNFSTANTTYDALRNSPWADLAQYQSVIQPLAGMGNTTSQTNPYYTNQAAGILGGAMTGSQIAKNLGFGGGSNGFVNSGYSDLGSGLTIGKYSSNTGFNW